MSAPEVTPVTHPRVNVQTFLAVSWAGTGLALAFVIFRLWVRIYTFRKLYVDDFLVILAWLSLLAIVLTFQILRGPFYAIFTFDVLGEPPSKLEQFEANELIFQRASLAIQLLFYVSFWAVKFSFLVFFRRLGIKVIGLKIWWWTVTGITAAGFIASIGDIEYACLTKGLAYADVHCDTVSALNFQNGTLRGNCAIDVVTDALIITIPVVLLWNVRISLRQKLALLGLFSLTMLTMATSIIRVAVVGGNSHQQVDITWLYFWTNIEMFVSIIVACLGSFRQLFVKTVNPPNTKAEGVLKLPSDNMTFWRRGLFSFSLFTRRSSNTSPSKSYGSSSNNSKFSKGAEHQYTSQEHIIPFDTIHIKNNTRFETEQGSNVEPTVLGSCYSPTENRRYDMEYNHV